MEAGVCQGQPRPHFPSSIFPMDSPKSSKRLIAKNTVFLVGRSIFGILIGLYASRILLAKLGIENYGTYHIVGGVVVMFNSIRSLFTNAIQRYLNYSKGDTQKQNLIFNTGIQVQLILVGVFLIIAESIGLYAVLHLNLSEEQFKAAHVVYQLSVAAAVILMLTIPYDALIISKEKMNVFAWLSILGQVLSLGIIYLIGLGPFSLLVNYAILVFAVSLFLRYVSVTYCQRHFEESRIRKIHDKTLISEMTAFAGWNFLGRTGLYVSHQGIDYILNLTGGVVVNAARSITYSVMKGANALVGNANMAFKPQTNAAAANEDKKEFYRLLGYNAKTAYVCYLLIIVPLLIFAKQVIGLWLGQVPDYVITFLLAISSYHLLRSLHELVNQFFISIGEMKWYQIIEISTMALIVPVSWLLLKSGFPFWTVFVCMTLFEIINHVSTLWLAVKKYGFPLHYYVKDVYFPFIVMSLISLLLIYGGYSIGMPHVEQWTNIILWSVIIDGALTTAVAYIVLKKQERGYLINMVVSWIKRC